MTRAADKAREAPEGGRKGLDGASSAPASPETASLAAYIADMTAELATLAERSGLRVLAQFLNLARLEAETASRQLGGFEIARRPSNGPDASPKARPRRRAAAR
jgi:hypothetical protein